MSFLVFCQVFQQMFIVAENQGWTVFTPYRNNASHGFRTPSMSKLPVVLLHFFALKEIWNFVWLCFWVCCRVLYCCYDVTFIECFTIKGSKVFLFGSIIIVSLVGTLKTFCFVLRNMALLNKVLAQEQKYIYIFFLKLNVVFLWSMTNRNDVGHIIHLNAGNSSLKSGLILFELVILFLHFLQHKK